MTRANTAAEKKRKGTDRNRTPTDTPTLKLGAPDEPPDLNANEKLLWHEFVDTLLEMGVLSPQDRRPLETLVRRFARWLELERFIEKNGETFATEKTGMVRPRPETALAKEALHDAQKMMIHFGMTPASRKKVTVIGKDIRGGGWEDL